MSTAVVLPKELGFWGTFTIGVGTMIGAGIFVLPAVAVAGAGPAATIAFLCGGLIALFTALSISELGTALPKAGGAYYYIDDALGPLFGTVAGLGNWLGLAAATAFYLVGFGSYLAILLPLPAFDMGFFSFSPRQFGGIAAAILLVGINYYGARESGILQLIIVSVLVAILVFFVAIGIGHFEISNLRPYAPTATGGWTGILPTAGLIFVTYLGFAEINTAAEEMKNPDRNLPRAVIGSLVFVIVLYAAFMTVLTGVADWRLIAEFGDVAVARVAESMIGVPGLVLLTLAGLLATLSSGNASILASSRINFAMGRDQIVSSKLDELHPRFETPYRAILLTGLLILGFMLIDDIEVLAKAGSVLHLIVYGLLNVALIVYREADVPEYDPAFRTPLYPYVPIAGALLSFGLIAFMAPIEIGVSIMFVAIGILWYALYARTHTPKAGVLNEYIETHEEAFPESVVAAAETIEPRPPDHRILVILTGADTDRDRLELAWAIAEARDGTVVAVRLFPVRHQVPLGSGLRDLERFTDPATEARLDAFESDGEVSLERHTMLTRNPTRAVLSLAEAHDAELAIVGWDNRARWSRGRVGTGVEALTAELPCDVLAVRRGERFDPETILIPTSGGPDSALAAELAAAMRDRFDSEIRVLHVVAPGSRDAGKEFLEAWTTKHGLSEADRIVTEANSPTRPIIEESEDASVLFLGATGKGALWRVLEPSLDWRVLAETEATVILVERARDRTLRERLLGRRRRNRPD